MFWESKDTTCTDIEMSGEKILEISNGWYIDKVFYPDRNYGDEINSLIIEIRRGKEEQSSFLLGKFYQFV